MKKALIGLAVFVWNPASAAELELNDVEVRAGIPYVQEYVLPEGEEESEYLNRGPRSYQNPKYDGDLKLQMCVLEFVQSITNAARVRGDIDATEAMTIKRIIHRDRVDLKKIDRQLYLRNNQFFKDGRKKHFEIEGIDYCNG